jgi:hypothetical protein
MTLGPASFVHGPCLGGARNSEQGSEQDCGTRGTLQLILARKDCPKAGEGSISRTGASHSRQMIAATLSSPLVVV